LPGSPRTCLTGPLPSLQVFGYDFLYLMLFRVPFRTCIWLGVWRVYGGFLFMLRVSSLGRGYLLVDLLLVTIGLCIRYYAQQASFWCIYAFLLFSGRGFRLWFGDWGSQAGGFHGCKANIMRSAQICSRCISVDSAPDKWNWGGYQKGVLQYERIPYDYRLSTPLFYSSR
jgi:hypothetical protein